MKRIGLIFFMMISALCFAQTSEQEYLQLEHQRLLRVQAHEEAIQNYIVQNIGTYNLPALTINKINSRQDEAGNPLLGVALADAIIDEKKEALRETYLNQNPSVKNDYTALLAAGPCTNSGFEIGDSTSFSYTSQRFSSSWSIYNNFPTTGVSPSPNGIIEIVDNSQNDNIIPTLPRVRSGNYAVRLNNSADGNYDVSRMTRLFDVQQNNLTFNYALVLQDPDHGDNLNPYYHCIVTTLSGTKVFERKIVANRNNTQVFKTAQNGAVVYTDWLCESIDVSQYLGQTLRIELIVGDCGQGAHWGYAYFDNFCETKCSAPSFGKVVLEPMGITCPLLPLTVSGRFIAPTGYELDKLTLKAKNITTGGIEYTSPQGQYTLFGSDFNFTVTGADLFPSGASNKQFDFFVTATFKLIGGTSTMDVESQSANDGPDAVFTTDCKICNSCAPPSSTYYFKGFWPAGTHGQGGYVIYINEFGNTETVIIGHAEDPCQGIAGVVSIVQKVGVVPCDQ